MRSDLDHLPDKQQGELAHVIGILRQEFGRAIATATQPWKKNGKILKVILFGSYARDDWVDEPENGYQSDFDLLIIVSHEDLTDITITGMSPRIGSCTMARLVDRSTLSCTRCMR